MSIFKQIRSILGKTIELSPPSAEDAKKVSSEPIERRSRERLSSHEGRRILIVDDSPTILAALKRMLQSAGCKTVEVMDAKSALDFVSKRIPDLIFLDIVLPGMSGFTALRMLRRTPATQHIPIIMISGNEQATEQFYVKRIGADDFMKKPFSRFEVFARMDALVEAGKLPRRTQEAGSDKRQEKSASVAAVAAPAGKVVATPRVDKAVVPPATAKPVTPVDAAKPDLSALEARKRLTYMGLKYYSQPDFIAAIARDDKLAIELFIVGGGVDINV